MHHALTIVRCHQPPGLVHSCAVFRGGAGVLSGRQSMAWLLGQLGLRRPAVVCVLLVVC